jgi:hypothetical protein
MILEYDLPSQCTRPKPLASASTMVPKGRPPRIARLLALAHKLDRMVRQGEVESFGDLARLGHITRARLSQITALLALAPAIQEYILFLSAGEGGFITEAQLRKIAREPRWDRQRTLFKRFMRV